MDEQLNRTAGVSPAAKTFTPKQGQYLAYIHLYTRLHRGPPAEADMQEYFRVTPPSVHQMALTLERQGLIHAALSSSLIRPSFRSYPEIGFNLSNSLCTGTSSSLCRISEQHMRDDISGWEILSERVNNLSPWDTVVSALLGILPPPTITYTVREKSNGAIRTVTCLCADELSERIAKRQFSDQVSENST